MKVLITGANGQLGHELCASKPKDVEIFAFNKNGEIYWIFNNIEEDKKSLVAWGHIVKNKNKINNIIESINKKKCTKVDRSSKLRTN